MRWARGALIVTLMMFGAASPAAAQSADAAAARAFIESQSAEDIFEALPNANARLVRHRASGMLCIFANGTDAQLQVFGQTRGEDVACVQRQSNGAEAAMFATRFADRVTAQEALDSAVRSLARWSWTGTPERMERQNTHSQPLPSAEAIFFGTLDGRRSFVRLATAVTPDGWIIKQRFVAPLTLPGRTEAEWTAEAQHGADMVFDATIGELARR